MIEKSMDKVQTGWVGSGRKIIRIVFISIKQSEIEKQERNQEYYPIVQHIFFVKLFFRCYR